MKRFATVLAIGGLLFIAAPASANDNTWTGAGSPAWGTGGNWSGPGGIPSGDGDTATINGLAWGDGVAPFKPVQNVADLEIGKLTMAETGSGISEVNIDNALTVTAGAHDGGCNFDGAVTITGDSDLTCVGIVTLASDTVLTYSNTGALSGTTLTIDANADSAARSFEFKKSGSGGTYTASGQVTITSDAGAANNAILIVSSGTMDVNAEVELNGASTTGNSIAEVEVQTNGTFTPDSLDLNGGDSTSRTALLELIPNVTVSGTGGDPTTTMETVAEGYVDFDVDAIFQPKDMQIDASAAYAQIRQITGTGEVEPTSLTISAGNSTDFDALYLLSAGTLDVNGAVAINGPTTAGIVATAELQVDSGTTFTPDSLEFVGGTVAGGSAVLDIAVAVTVGANGTDMEGFIKFQGNQILNAKAITITATGTLDHESTADLDADSLTIDATSVAKTFTLKNDGVFDINGEVDLTSGTTGSLQPKLVVDSTATNFQPDKFDLNGHSAAGREAVLDFDADVTVAAAAGTELAVFGRVNIEIKDGKVYTARTLVMETDNSTSLKVSGENTGTKAAMVIDGFTQNGGEYIIENNMEVRF